MTFFYATLDFFFPRCSQVPALKFISVTVIWYVTCIGRQKILSGFRKCRFNCSILCMYLMTSVNEFAWNHLWVNLACSSLLSTPKATSKMWCSVWGLINQVVNWGPQGFWGWCTGWVMGGRGSWRRESWGRSHRSLNQRELEILTRWSQILRDTHERTRGNRHTFRGNYDRI